MWYKYINKAVTVLILREDDIIIIMDNYMIPKRKALRDI